MYILGHFVCSPSRDLRTTLSTILPSYDAIVNSLHKQPHQGNAKEDGCSVCDCTMRQIPNNTAIAAVSAALREQEKPTHTHENALVRKVSLALQHSWSTLRRRNSGTRNGKTGVSKAAPGSPHPLRSSARRAPSGVARPKKALELQKTDDLAAATSRITLNDTVSPSSSKTGNGSRRTVTFSSEPAQLIPYQLNFPDENEPRKQMRSTKAGPALHSGFIKSASEHPDLMGVFNMLDSYKATAPTQAVA